MGPSYRSSVCRAARRDDCTMHLSTFVQIVHRLNTCGSFDEYQMLVPLSCLQVQIQNADICYCPVTG